MNYKRARLQTNPSPCFSQLFLAVRTHGEAKGSDKVQGADSLGKAGGRGEGADIGEV